MSKLLSFLSCHYFLCSFSRETTTQFFWLFSPWNVPFRVSHQIARKELFLVKTVRKEWVCSRKFENILRVVSAVIYKTLEEFSDLKSKSFWNVWCRACPWGNLQKLTLECAVRRQKNVWSLLRRLSAAPSIIQNCLSAKFKTVVGNDSVDIWGEW